MHSSPHGTTTYSVGSFQAKSKSRCVLFLVHRLVCVVIVSICIAYNIVGIYADAKRAAVAIRLVVVTVLGVLIRIALVHWAILIRVYRRVGPVECVDDK